MLVNQGLVVERTPSLFGRGTCLGYLLVSLPSAKLGTNTFLNTRWLRSRFRLLMS